MPENNAVVILHEMSADEEMREIARLREKAVLDERSAINFARKESRIEAQEEIISRMRKKGYTEEQIQDLLGDEY